MKTLYALAAMMFPMATVCAQQSENFSFIKNGKIESRINGSQVTQIKVSDGTLTGIDNSNGTIFSKGMEEIDHIAFADIPEVNGVALAPSTVYPGWFEIAINLSQGQEIELSEGAGELLQETFFLVEGNSATFIGNDGDYKLYMNPEHSGLYLETVQRGNVDGVIWVAGRGIGHPSAAGESVTSELGWGNPSDVQMGVKLGDNCYQATVYLAKDFEFKLYMTPGQESNGDYDTNEWVVPYPASLIDAGWDGESTFGHFNGKYVAGFDFEPGVYTIFADKNNLFLTLLKADEYAPDLNFNGWPNRKVNGVPVKEWNGTYFNGNTVWADLYLEQGQEMTFEGFYGLEYSLSPDFFEFRDGKWYYIAPSTTPDNPHRLMFSDANRLFYFMGCQTFSYDANTGEGKGLWLRGKGLAHPFTDWDNAMSSDNFQSFADGAYEAFWAPNTAAGIYEATLTLGVNDAQDLQLHVYYHKFERGEDKILLRSEDATIVNEYGCYFGKNADNFTFGVADIDNFIPGTYHIKIDMNTKTVTFSQYTR
ncbi:MAG: hypothetical protein NC082_02300 [Clostridiales bacterium]|nr:hypothetical protein [Clostridiales bacterium]